MLSYRHSYHAGNFADVLKHIVLIEILEHLIKKEKPFDYIDTHAGAGLYNLRSDHAQKIQEFKNGIAKINFDKFPELSLYQDILKKCNDGPDIKFYPGSPYIAGQYLRDYDRSWLYELHPSDYKILDQLVTGDRRIRVECGDGFKGLMAKVPPRSKRALVLIDPSYEIKDDYDRVIEVIIKAHKKFATGIYAIWYPVIQRTTINRMETLFRNSGIKNIQLFELGLTADTTEKGMTSSGMIVINPPWTLMEKMKSLLPRLAKVISHENQAVIRAVQLTDE
jgi:23S rRNA (adenine2030-N6)-methyltransferase